MDGSTRIILDKELAKSSIQSLISHVILNSYRRNMYKKTSVIMASAVAAILIVSVLAVAMPNQAFARNQIVIGGNGGVGGAGGAGGVGGPGGINIIIGGHSWHFP
jgi:hypothetical protein